MKSKIKIIAGFYIGGFISILIFMSVIAALSCLAMGFLSFSWVAFGKLVLKSILFSFIAIVLALSLIIIDDEMLSGVIANRMGLCIDNPMSPKINNGVCEKYFCCPVCGERVAGLIDLRFNNRLCIHTLNRCEKCGQALDWTNADYSAVYGSI